MKSFWRIFKYVWPQWPRLAAIIFTAVLIAILFSVSFMTIMPLLKVMMGEEGLHGWVDRKTCHWRFGVDFYVPDTVSFTQTNAGIAYYLLITDVKKPSPAHAAGLIRGDKIVAAGTDLSYEDEPKVPSARLFETLATAPPEGTITLQVRRANQQGATEDRLIRLNTSRTDPSIIDNVRTGAAGLAQRSISFMPRDEDRANRKRAVIFIILLMAVVTTTRCIAKFYQTYLAEKVVQVAAARLREDAFEHVMDMPVGYFSNEGTSDTISRLLGDISTIVRGVKILLGKTLREPLKALGTLLCAALINWKLTMIFLGCAPVTVWLLGSLGKKIKRATRRSLISSALMLGKLQGVMKALRVVKVYNRQKHEVLAYAGLNRRFLRQILRVAKVQAATGPIMEILGMIAGSAALLVGTYWIFSASVSMQPSAFFTLLVLLGTTAESIRKVSDVWNKVQQANAAAERVYSVVDQPLEVEDSDAVELEALRDKIEFRDVNFTYPKGNRPVLNRINLTVKTGQTVAIVGPNGSGKTTLVNLMPRFYDIDSGQILIDGTDIRHCTLKSLRDQVGMVTQEVVTFNDTIAANIGYGKRGATMDDIIASAKRSFAHEFIEPLPNGYDTLIGEHGSGFSGGQLQRIVIARAILKDPAILIFDEATSQIDADSEAKIHQAIAELMRGRTCFVIAHRFSTILSADNIIVMEDGQIAARGTHEQLSQSCTLYQNLYETQMVVSE
ncbi:MAG TPA: ATP-binding cassette domain-containing protein [Planctomycetes bacterium]|nr:ATP-binding cassette domain-containing protein [Planctomycetota bacterium]HIJ71226.1 ATP-binding cassette domain-containing protein [Planctomycetota bacterium]